MARKPSIAPLLWIVGAGAAGFVGYRVWDNLDRLGLVASHQWEVQGHRWTRTIHVTQHGTWQEEAWCARMRSAYPEAVDVQRERRQSGSEQVKTGERCRPGEPLEPCTPIYEERAVEDDWCRFTWTGDKEVRKLEASGEDLAARWPDLDLGPDEQEGERKATYTVVLTRSGEQSTCAFDERTWRSLLPGTAMEGDESVRYGTLKCPSLRPVGSK